MVTASEILRWFYYRFSGAYLRLARIVMRRDRLVVGTERKFRALLETSPDAIVIVNWHGHIVLVNAQAEHVLGYERREVVGEHASALLPERHRPRFRHNLKAYLRDPKLLPMGASGELHGRRKDGSEFPAEISISPLGTEQGLLISTVIRDVTERRLDEAKLRHLADHDGLTGLLNRRCLRGPPRP